MNFSGIPDSLLRELEELFGGGCYGFAPAESGDFACVIALMQPYSQRLDAYDEARLHAIIERERQTLHEKTQKLCALLASHGIEHRVPPPAQRDEDALVAEVSFKRAAVLAGLGFVGRNDLFVSERYGPRVRLGAVLCGLSAPAARPLPSRCGDCCLCVDACPHGCLTGAGWTLDSLRAELIDYPRCNKIRRRSLPILGRKHTCGYCLLACPYSQDNLIP